MPARPRSRKSLGDDFGGVARQGILRLDALKRESRLLAASRFQRSPALERRGEPRSDLRVERVEADHGICDELVAATGRLVEADRIGAGKRTDESSHLVRLLERACPL